MAESKKSKKHGRSKRSPSHTRYIAENRSEKNKKRKIAKQKRKEKKQAARKAIKQNR